MLRRAVGNLIDNAVAYGQVVTVRLHETAGELRILGEDDGPGIPEADLVRLAEPFVCLNASRSLDTGGVGLGMAIVRDVAAYHGGQLILESRSEGGLRATLALARSRSP